jgi:Protein of unknown function (DUF3800)
VLVLHGYFDESGTHVGSKALSVAGYLSTVERWLDFEQEWKRALKEFGGQEFFHMTDFVGRQGIYKTWTENERKERLTRLIAIINRNVVAGVGFAVSMQSYFRLFSKKAKRYCGGAYGLAAISCFFDSCTAVRASHPDARIAYVFEAGARGHGQVLKVFDDMFSRSDQREAYKMLSLKFEGKKNFAPLQAADILSYELYRQLPVERREVSGPPRINVLTELRKCPINYWKTYDEETMIDFAQVIDAAADLYGPQGPKSKPHWKRR